MKMRVGIVLAFLAALIAQPLQVDAIDTTFPPERLSTSPLIITAYYISAAMPGYFEVYNNGSDTIDIRDWSLQLKWSLLSTAPAGSVVNAPLTLPLATTPQYLPPHHYAVIGFGATVATPSILFDALDGSPGNYINEISLQNIEYKPYVKTFTSAQSQRMVLGETSTGYTSTGTYAIDIRTALYDSGLYSPLMSDFPLAPVEVLANPRNCSPNENDTACHEYVKFYNGTSAPISFDGTRLRIGYQSQSISSSNTVILGGVVAPGEYAVFDTAESGEPLSISNSGGYIWLEDTYGIVSYPSTIVAYADASTDSHKGQAWTNFDGVWQWAIPNPGGINTPLPAEVGNSDALNLAPCRADQYRNPETNRCKAIETLSTPAACDTGEYRNPETGRCKKITSSSGSSLQPCDEGQYRNPETNRCKAIASQTASLAPCQAGWERNPDTNRCRKAQNGALPISDFAPQPYEQTKTSGLGWLAFASVGTGVIGYGIWEWRSEIIALKRRLSARFVR